MDAISTLQFRHNRRGRRLAAPLVCLALGALVLSGCGSARQTFGLDRTPPDEFSRPDPRTAGGAAGIQAASARARRSAPAGVGYPPAGGIRGVRLGPADPPAGGGLQRRRTTGKSALLNQAGAAEVQPGIRTTVNRDAATAAAQDTGFIDSLLFWQKQDPPGTVVNAKEEQQRLRENAALGKPVTEGDTPVIERRRKAPLEGLFN